MPERETLHPALAAALERDGISVAELARLVELSPKTVNRWSDALRDLCDFISGRARAVKVEGGPIGGPAYQGWLFERLGDEGAAPAVVARALASIDSARRSLETASSILGTSATIRGPSAQPDGGTHGDSIAHLPQKSFTSDLPHSAKQGSPKGMMNVALVQRVAQDVWDRSRTEGMISIHKKVPRDHIARLEAAAKAAGISDSDYLRALIEMNTPPITRSVDED